jgi:putative SOS response-associated peptidase YedK
MCNLYSVTKGQVAIRDWFRARNDRTGNLPLFPGIFPDQTAPIVRAGDDGERELVMARWGSNDLPRAGVHTPRCDAAPGNLYVRRCRNDLDPDIFAFHITSQ